MSAPAPSRATFKPGQAAPASGIYRVTHGESHRPPHDLTLKQGEVFPACRRCDEKVRFRLKVRGANPVEH